MKQTINIIPNNIFAVPDSFREQNIVRDFKFEDISKLFNECYNNLINKNKEFSKNQENLENELIEINKNIKTYEEREKNMPNSTDPKDIELKKLINDAILLYKNKYTEVSTKISNIKDQQLENLKLIKIFNKDNIKYEFITKFISYKRSLRFLTFINSDELNETVGKYSSNNNLNVKIFNKLIDNIDLCTEIQNKIYIYLYKNNDKNLYKKEYEAYKNFIEINNDMIIDTYKKLIEIKDKNLSKDKHLEFKKKQYENLINENNIYFGIPYYTLDRGEKTNYLNLLNEIKLCKSKNKRFMKINLSLGIAGIKEGNKMGYHANSIIIDTFKKRFYIIEPQITNEWHNTVITTVFFMFPEIYTEYEYITLEDLCPTAIMQQDDSLCGTWVMMVTYYYFSKLNLDDKYEISFKTLMDGLINNLDENLIEFIYYLYNKMKNDKEFMNAPSIKKDVKNKYVLTDDDKKILFALQQFKFMSSHVPSTIYK